jgi:uncharacterized protein YjbJ (UPF0337 family)
MNSAPRTGYVVCSPGLKQVNQQGDRIHLFKEEVCAMGLPNKDEVKGKFDQVKGNIKQKAGRAFNDPELDDEGSADRAGGEVREGYGKARRKVGETLEDIGKAVGK